MNKKLGFAIVFALIIIGGGWWYFNTSGMLPIIETAQSDAQKNAGAEAGTRPTPKLFAKQTPSDPQGVINATGLVLQGNGLEVLTFGASPEAVIPRLTSMIGTPTKDTGWISSFSTYGTCPGEKIRVVEWNRLRAFFGDTAFGTQKFFQWEYVKTGTGTQSPIIATKGGVTLDMTKAEVLALYSQARFTPWMENTESMLLVADNAATHEHLGGTLEGGKVSYLSGGIQCGE